MSAGTNEHAERWVWFVEVVFGAIVALGIGSYGTQFIETLQSPAGVDIAPLLLSFFVMAAISSFVVYDIVVYQGLAKKFPYNFSGLGFFRFYLDLFMAFLLYLLIANTFRIYPYPDWLMILVVISLWHLAAMIWHLLAQLEVNALNIRPYTIGPHFKFIVIYWLSALLARITGVEAFALEGEMLSVLILVVTCMAIFAVSLYRWNQVVKKVFTHL